MIDTTHTLAIISDFFNRTSEDKLEAFPKPVASVLVDLREELANFFLTLDYNEGKLSGHVDKLTSQREKLVELFVELRKVIKPYVSISIGKLP